MPRPDLRPDAFPEKDWEPNTWTSRHELICDLHLAGYENWRIAEELNYSESRVSVILSDQRAAEYVRSIRSGIKESVSQFAERRLQGLLPLAFDVIEEDLRMAAEQMGRGERIVRSKSAFGVLASLGYGPVQKQVRANISDAIPAGLLERSEKAVEELREMRGKFTYQAPEVPEEAEFEEVRSEAA